MSVCQEKQSGKHIDIENREYVNYVFIWQKKIIYQKKI